MKGKPSKFVFLLRKKGYTVAEIARRWGISPRRISQIGREPSQRDWDALAGLPSKDYIFLSKSKIDLS